MALALVYLFEPPAFIAVGMTFGRLSGEPPLHLVTSFGQRRFGIIGEYDRHQQHYYHCYYSILVGYAYSTYLAEASNMAFTTDIFKTLIVVLAIP